MTAPPLARACGCNRPVCHYCAGTEHCEHCNPGHPATDRQMAARWGVTVASIRASRAFLSTISLYQSESIMSKNGTTVFGASGDWMKSPAFLANAGHVGWGLALTLLAVFFAPLWRAHPLYVPAIWQVIFTPVVLFKEYFIDLRYESDEDVASSSVDAIGWHAGAVVAWGVALLGHALGIWP